MMSRLWGDANNDKEKKSTNGCDFRTPPLTMEIIKEMAPFSPGRGYPEMKPSRPILTRRRLPFPKGNRRDQQGDYDSMVPSPTSISESSSFGSSLCGDEERLPDFHSHEMSKINKCSKSQDLSDIKPTKESCTTSMGSEKLQATRFTFKSPFGSKIDHQYVTFIRSNSKFLSPRNVKFSAKSSIHKKYATEPRSMTAPSHETHSDTKIPHHLSPYYPKKYLVLAERRSNHKRRKITTRAYKGVQLYNLKQEDANICRTKSLASCMSLGVRVFSIIEGLLCVYDCLFCKKAKAGSYRFVTNPKKRTSPAIQKILRAYLAKYGGKISMVLSRATIAGSASIYNSHSRHIRMLNYSKGMKYEGSTWDYIKAMISSHKIIGFETGMDYIHVMFLISVTFQVISWAWKWTQHHTGHRSNLQWIWQMIQFHLILGIFSLFLPVFQERSQFVGFWSLRSIFELCTLHLANLLDILLDAGIVKALEKLTFIAFGNPALFVSNLNKFLLVIRWISFLAPLIGTTNKLRGNVQDLICKWNLRCRTLKANLHWDGLSKSLKRKRILEDAVVSLQAKFRGRRERRALNVLRVWKCNESMNSETRVATWLVQQAALARKRVERSKSFDLSCESPLLFAPVRKRMRTKYSNFENERALVSLATMGLLEIKCEQRALLMRPNTRFAVGWKVVTVTCVIVELLHKALASKTTMDAFIKGALLQKHQTEYFCASSLWWWIAQGLVATVPFVVTMVCFTDVFVTFFTGEVQGGKLVPKPWVTRWLVPGVALQLIVNPTMGTIVKGLKSVMQGCWAVGTCRSLWIIVLGIVPIWNWFFDHFTRFIWRNILIPWKLLD